MFREVELRKFGVHTIDHALWKGPQQPGRRGLGGRPFCGAILCPTPAARLSALRAHTKAPYTTDSLWER